MSAALSFGKTTLVLLGLWGVLAVIGLVAGVIPWPHGTSSTTADAGVEEIPEAGVDADAGVPSDAASEITVDAGTEPPPTTTVAAPPTGPALRRLRVCAEPTLAPSLALLDVIGDASPEIVVGCGASWEVIARSGTDWMRVAHVIAPAMTGDRSPLSSAPLAVDVDGDGDADTLFPLARVGAGGSTSGGGLFVLTRAASGALESPRSLAPIAAVGASAITLGSGPGLVALDRANPFAREPSEAWVFTLGASPSRVSTPRAGTDATGLGVLDVDRDGKLDIVVASSGESRIDVLYGDDTNRFARSRTLSSPSATDIAIGDLDGDGAADALIVGATVTRLFARADAEPALMPIEGAPELRDAAIADIDHDGHADIVAWSPPRLVVLAGRADQTYETRTLFELAAGEVGPRRQVVADVDGDGQHEVVLLAVGQDGAQRMLDLVVVPSSERGLVRTEAPQPLPDAPLMLTITLPDPNAP